MKPAIVGVMFLAACGAVGTFETGMSSRPEAHRSGFPSPPEEEAPSCAPLITNVSYRDADFLECERLAGDLAAQARRAGATPRVEFVDGSEAAAQEGRTCSADDGPVLVVDY